MKRIYISGAITGVEGYMENFERAEEELIKKGYTSIVNPAKVNSYLPADFSHEDYMEVCFAELKCCEAIYMLDGWVRSKGAVDELNMACERGMEVIYQ